MTIRIDKQLDKHKLRELYQSAYTKIHSQSTGRSLAGFGPEEGGSTRPLRSMFCLLYCLPPSTDQIVEDSVAEYVKKAA